jgi:hypothetical protein
MYFLVSKKPLLSYICQINLIFDIVKERIFYDRALMENKVYNKDGKQIDLKSHLAGKTVGIYFSAHWFVQLCCRIIAHHSALSAPSQKYLGSHSSN